MTDIVIQAKKNGLAVNGLADDPEITIIRLDTDAVVVNGDAMTDTGTGGLYKYAFTPVQNLRYAFSVEADPSATGQTDDFFYSGGFDFGSVTANYVDGAIWIDTTGGGSAGTVIGVNGIPTNPCNNIGDAITLANNTGLQQFKIRGSVTLTAGIPGFAVENISGQGNFDPAGFDVGNCYFDRVNLIGNINTTSGSIFVNQSSILNTTGFQGIAYACGIGGTNTLGAGLTTFTDCVSIVPGTSTPVIDLNSVASLNLRDYSGGIELRGSTTAGQNTSLEFSAGQCILDASNTDGVIAVRGVVSPVTDNTAGATVVQVAAVQGIHLDDIWQNEGLDPDNSKTITENVAGADYDEAVGSISKSVTKVGAVTTIDRA